MGKRTCKRTNLYKEMNKSILWTQGVDNSGLFSLDEGCITSGQPSYQELFTDFISATKVKKWDFINDDIRVYYDGSKSVITGWFNETDDMGRRVTYTLFHAHPNPSSAVASLNKLSSNINYTLPEKITNLILLSLQLKARKIKTMKRVAAYSSIAFVVILSVVLLIKCN